MAAEVRFGVGCASGGKRKIRVCESESELRRSTPYPLLIPVTPLLFTPRLITSGDRVPPLPPIYWNHGVRQKFPQNL